MRKGENENVIHQIYIENNKFANNNNYEKKRLTYRDGRTKKSKTNLFHFQPRFHFIYCTEIILFETLLYIYILYFFTQ